MRGMVMLAHSITLLVQPLRGRPRMRTPSTVPCIMVLHRLSCRVTWPNHASFRRLTMARRGLWDQQGSRRCCARTHWSCGPSMRYRAASSCISSRTSGFSYLKSDTYSSASPFTVMLALIFVCVVHLVLDFSVLNPMPYARVGLRATSRFVRSCSSLLLRATRSISSAGRFADLSATYWNGTVVIAEYLLQDSLRMNIEHNRREQTHLLDVDKCPEEFSRVIVQKNCAARIHRCPRSACHIYRRWQPVSAYWSWWGHLERRSPDLLFHAFIYFSIASHCSSVQSSLADLILFLISSSSWPHPLPDLIIFLTSLCTCCTSCLCFVSCASRHLQFSSLVAQVKNLVRSEVLIFSRFLPSRPIPLQLLLSLAIVSISRSVIPREAICPPVWAWDTSIMSGFLRLVRWKWTRGFMGQHVEASNKMTYSSSRVTTRLPPNVGRRI